MKQFRAFWVTGFSLFLFFGVGAQSSRPDFNRQSNYDVQHYILRVSFDRAAKRIIGDTTVRLKPLAAGFRQVTLDSVGISYSSVTLEETNSPLNYLVQGDQVVVDLDRTYTPQQTIGIRFKYSASPKKGIYFIDKQPAADGVPARTEQIWTQGEPDEARHWFPSFDFPSDKATVEQFITANAHEEVIGNGLIVAKSDNADGTVVHHFKMDIPFSTYLVSFVVGDYAAVAEKYKNIPLGYYVYAGTEAVVPKAYGRTKDMFRVFEELTGVDYPFPKYDQTVVAAFAFGGMENMTATTMSDRDIFLVNNPLFEATVEDLVSHELAHSWFGNLVTCKNWAELWLNEGFATFMEAAFREKKYGRRSYLQKIVNDADQFKASDATGGKRHGLFNRNAAKVTELFDVPYTTYNKGGAVLHTLREQIGDAAFWRGVNIYLNRHKLGNVESTDLKAAMEEGSGSDLDWFFDQWVYGLGYPKLNVKQVYSNRSKTLTLTVTQTQKPDNLTPPAFTLPLDIDVETTSGLETEKIELKKRSETFKFKLVSRPLKITIDKNEKIPIKTVKIAALTTTTK